MRERVCMLVIDNFSITCRNPRCCFSVGIYGEFVAWHGRGTDAYRCAVQKVNYINKCEPKIKTDSVLSLEVHLVHVPSHTLRSAGMCLKTER